MLRNTVVGRASRSFVAVALLALAAAGSLTSSADAASVVEIFGNSSGSTEGLGSFTGSISYDTAGPLSTTGTLVITLTNTSSPANGGYITGFLFNIGSSDAGASAILAAAPAPTHPFTNCTGTGLNGMPFGNPFDAGAALGGDFHGGAGPAAGIAVGQTGTFTFNVSASDAGLLTAMDFFDGGPYDFNFIVRFRGFDDNGSDMVPGQVVPLPPALAMGMIGLVGAAIGSRRMNRRRQPGARA